MRRPIITHLVTLTLGILTSGWALANPVLNSVISGNVSISQTPNNTVVNQSSSKAIINWSSFNIGASESTHFQQPQGGMTLNHIDPTHGGSQIYGKLTSTGQIILVNPAGIYFGPSAFVNVGGIIASTSEIANENFLNGQYHFDQPSSYQGAVINAGYIRAAKYGLVALVGTGVENDGTIHAHLGSIVLASGNKFTIDMTGNQLINFTIDEAASSSSIDQNGHALKNGVKNTGALIADGGTIIISASTGSAILDHAINMQGIAVAKSVGTHQGDIILSGGTNGDVYIAGELNASSKSQNAGNINIHGENIDVANSAVLNASAMSIGNGGNINVIANNSASIHGTLLAMGGSQSGHGGAIETSANVLNVSNITLNLSAAKGKSGTWLLDPENLIIQNAGTTTATASGSPTNNYTSNVDDSILTVSDLENALNNASVIVQTGSGGTQAGNITVADSITWNNTNALTLTAYHDIDVNAAITNSSGGSLILRADNTGTGSGTINDTASITMSGGGTVNFYYNPASFPTPDTFSNVSASGGTVFTPYMLIDNATQLQNMNNNLSGNYALAADINLTGNFAPVGSASTPFTGNFDGQNFAINNLSITTASAIDIGLFGQISGSTIQNLTLNNPTLSINTTNNGQSIFIGPLVGLDTSGTISNVTITNPTIQANGINEGMSGGNRGYYDVGGAIGGAFGGSINSVVSNDGAITNNVNTIGNSGMTAFNEVGGLIGGEHNTVSVENVSSSNNITVNSNITMTDSSAIGEVLIGGVVGRLDQNSILYNASSSGKIMILTTMQNPVAGTAYELVGGLIGATSIADSPMPIPPSVVDNSFSTSAITVDATLTNSLPTGTMEFAIGGLFGQANGVTTNSHASGSVTVIFNSDPTASGGTLDIGGVAGINFTTIYNSYNTGNISVTGTNDGNQVQIGGLVGQHITLFDKEVTDDYSTGLINIAMNNNDAGVEYIGSLIGGLVYYGSAPTTWPFTDNYSNAILNISGQNNGSTTVIGGLIGANGTDAGDPGGNINNSYTTAFINNNVTTVNGGTTYAGGLVGSTIGSTASLTNDFYDTGTTGLNQNQGVGNQPGLQPGVTPGCYGGGACPNGGSADLSSQTTYTSAGWNFTTTWDIFNNTSYPFLQSGGSGTPQVVSGTAVGGAGNFVDLVNNGTVLETTVTGNNGFFYFFVPGGEIATNSLVLVYLQNAPNVGNTVFAASTLGNTPGLSILANTLSIGDSNPGTVANSDMSGLITGITDPNNILFSALGNNVTVGTALHPNIDLVTSPTTIYQLSGNLDNFANSTGTVTFNGPLSVSNVSEVTSQQFTFENGITGGGNLTLNGQTAANAFSLTGALTLNNLIINGDINQINSLSVDEGALETWNITGTNTGNITGVSGITSSFDFNRINHLTGGNNGNSFIFADGALLQGTITGGNVAFTNTLSYANYVTPVNINLFGSLYAGSTANGTIFSNINALIGNDISQLILANATNKITFTAYNMGFVNNLMHFDRYDIFSTSSANNQINFVAPGIYYTQTNKLTVSGQPVTITGFNSKMFTGNITIVDGSHNNDNNDNNVKVTDDVSLIANIIRQATANNDINSTAYLLDANGLIEAQPVMFSINCEVNSINLLIGNIHLHMTPLQCGGY